MRAPGAVKVSLRALFCTDEAVKTEKRNVVGTRTLDPKKNPEKLKGNDRERYNARVNRATSNGVNL